MCECLLTVITVYAGKIIIIVVIEDQLNTSASSKDRKKGVNQKMQQVKSVKQRHKLYVTNMASCQAKGKLYKLGFVVGFESGISDCI